MPVAAPSAGTTLQILIASLCHRWTSCGTCYQTVWRLVAISELKMAPEVAIVEQMITHRETTPLKRILDGQIHLPALARSADRAIFGQW